MKRNLQQKCSLCYKCFVHNACTLTISEIKACLKENLSHTNITIAKPSSRNNETNKNKSSIKSDICAAIGIDPLNDTEKGNLRALTSSEGQPISSIAMQVFVSDIKQWSSRRGLFIARADCSNILYNKNNSTWEDWAIKFGLDAEDGIPEG